MKEKTYRSVAKTVSWRIVGTLDTVLISWLIIGDINWAISIGGFELFTKMGLYFLHERIWNKVKLGKIDPTEEKSEPIETENKTHLIASQITYNN